MVENLPLFTLPVSICDRDYAMIMDVSVWRRGRHVINEGKFT